MRPETVEGSRPNLGRRPSPKPPEPELVDQPTTNSDATDTEVNKPVPAKIQTSRPIRSTRNANPKYVDAVWSKTIANINSEVLSAYKFVDPDSYD